MELETFTYEEREALLLLLQRMGRELRPPRLPRKDLAQWDKRVDIAAERTLNWVDQLEPEKIITDSDGAEPGEPA